MKGDDRGGDKESTREYGGKAGRWEERGERKGKGRENLAPTVISKCRRL